MKIQNVNPTAVIDLTGTVRINGIATFIAHEGEVIPFTAGSSDPGSDDRHDDLGLGRRRRRLRTSTELSLNDIAVNPDPDPSPTINPGR